MSHTNNTPKIQLAQFVADDQPTWLGDWNSTMLTIDNAVGTVQEDLQTASGTLSTLSQEVSNINVDLNKVKPTNNGQVGQVLSKASDGGEWVDNSATNTTFNPTGTSISGTNVQDAITEVLAKIPKVQSGRIPASEISPAINDYKEYQVVFDEAFTTSPNVSATMEVGNASAKNLFIFVRNVSTTGFTIRVINTNTSGGTAYSVNVQWMAVGK